MPIFSYNLSALGGLQPQTPYQGTALGPRWGLVPHTQRPPSSQNPHFQIQSYASDYHVPGCCRLIHPNYFSIFRSSTTITLTRKIIRVN